MTTLDQIFQPVEWEFVDATIYDWATGLTGCEAIWQDQDLPQPPYPYLTLHRSPAIRAGGKPEIRTLTDLTQPLCEEIEVVATSQMEFTLNIQARMNEEGGANDPFKNSFQIVTLLQASLGLLSVQASFRAAGLSIIEELPVTDLSQVINGRFLSRASFDVRLRVASVMAEKTGFIEKVEIESTELGVGPEVLDAS